MSHACLFDPAFHAFLLAADQDLAAAARAARCPSCGGALHVSNYERRPSGGPAMRATRFSFCCADDGCRRRCTPGSFRFLGRKVYLGVVVIVASMLYHGLTPARRDRLISSLGVSERTLVRWRRWWVRDFAGSPFWRAARGLFGTPVESDGLPRALLERFDGDEEQQVRSMLRFLVPITGGKTLAAQAF